MDNNLSEKKIQFALLDKWKAIVNSGELADEDEAIQFYSIKSLKERLSQLRHIYSRFEALHTIAIKTNPHPFILKKIAKWGYGLEAASLQEVIMAANTGIDTRKIIFNSPVKTKRELEYASSNFPGVVVNANSIDELDRIPVNHNLNLGLRVNPMSGSETDDLYDVSGEYSKFGVTVAATKQILEVFERHNITQLHIHSGSRTTNFKKNINGIKQIVDLAQLINQQLGIRIHTINIGGGLSAGDNNQESLLWMKEYANLLLEECPLLNENFKIVTEFGQWVHEHQGAAFSKVEYVKSFDKKSIAYVHIGADMFVRQIYTKTNHLKILCLDKKGNLKDGKNRLYDIAGPLCFNGDFLFKNIMLPDLDEGDIIAIYPCGANTFGLWSRHCSRNIPALITDQINTDVVLKASKSWNPFLDNSLEENA